MSRDYNGENSPRGLLLLTYPESCQLATKEEFLPYIRETLSIKRGGNLSASTLEALAVVAYNQPVTRAEGKHYSRPETEERKGHRIDARNAECGDKSASKAM